MRGQVNISSEKKPAYSLSCFSNAGITSLVISVIVLVLLVTCAPLLPLTSTEGTVQPALPSPTLEPTFTPSPSTDTPVPSPTDTPIPEPTFTPMPRAGVSGRILDQDTHQPIAGAQVSADDLTTTTNADGRYTLTGLEPGQYVLSVTHPDYDPGLSSIFTLVEGQELEVELALYGPDTSPYPQDPMLTNPLDPNGAPTQKDAERLAREQGLTGQVVSIEETTLTGEYLVNYKIGDDIRAAVAEINHEAWELTDKTDRKWWIVKVCGNLASPLPVEKPIPTPKRVPLPPMAEVVVNKLSVRACTSEECAEVETVPGGGRVEVFGCLADHSWCEVSWSGGRGWCTGQSLRQLAVAEVVPVVKAVLPTAMPEVVVADQDRIVFTCVLYDYKVNDDGTFVTHPVDGSKIFDTKVDICVMNTDGSSLTRLTNDRNEDRYPAWSPSKAQIAFTRDLADIYVMNADGSGLRNITNNPDTSDADPTWSPDGRQIAFGSGQSGTCCTDIYIINVDGSGLAHLTPGSWSAWSPDGTKIAFVGDGIHVMNVDGSNLIRLTESGNAPNWSPDSQRIVFLDGIGLDNQEIFAINTDGSGLTRLTNRSDDDFWPDWSPDGQKIVFHSGRTGDAHIYIMNSDGSSVTRLTEGQPMNNGLTSLTQGWYPDW